MSYENPYAPPASDPRIHLEKKDSEVIVELDGYRHGKELLVNKHFISPPYCAKLGIPTDNKPTPVTIQRFPVYHPFITESIRIIVLVFTIIVAFYSIGAIFAAVTLYCIFSLFLTRFTTRPYQIKVPFSDAFRKRRKIRSYIYLGITLFLCLPILNSAMQDPYQLGILIPLLGFIALMFFRKTVKFIVVKQSGDYYYLRGVHPDYLAQLPEFIRKPSNTTF